MADTAVHNPPAGGPQDQASTNDDNVNDVLTTAPFVVTISDGETVGVVARFADKGDAEASAKAFKANRPSKRIVVKVVKENDISGGLPALVAEVEAAKAEVDEPEAKAAPKTSFAAK